MKILRILKNILRKFKGIYLKRKLTNRNFTIVSNNCWGGFVYKTFNLEYNSPFIGLFLFAPDYINLLKNFKNIINNELIFINPEESRYKDKLIEYGTFETYPIGKLDDGVEIHFLHYTSKKEAKEKWNKRVQRIDMNNLLVKFSDRDLCSEELIYEFNKLKFKNKLCFTAKEYKNSNTIVLKEFKGKECVENEWNYYKKYIDIVNIINSLKEDSIIYKDRDNYLEVLS